MIDILNKYNIGKKKLIAFGVFVILFLIVLPLTLIQVQKQQELRQRAQGSNNVYLELKPLKDGKNAIGAQFVQTLYFHNPKNQDISGVDISFSYNKDYLDVVDFISENNLSYIVKDTSIPGEVHLVGINSRQTHIIDSAIPLGAFILKAKKEASGAIDFSKVLVTAIGETQPLAINPTDNKPGSYTIGQEFSSITPTISLTETLIPSLGPIPIAQLTISPTLLETPTPTTFSSPSILPSPTSTPGNMPFTYSIFPKEGLRGTIFTVTIKTPFPLAKDSLLQTNFNIFSESFTNGITHDKSDSYADGHYNNVWTFDSSGHKPGEVGITFQAFLEGKDTFYSDKESITVSTGNTSDACIPITNNGDSSKKIDIVVISNNYKQEELDNFKNKILPKHIDAIFSKDPFSLNKDKFNVWFVNQASNQSCSLKNNTDCYSAFTNVAYNSCPFFDVIIAIDKAYSRSFTDMPSNGDKIAYNLGDEPLVTVHEFGHAFGDLGDEYDISNDPNYYRQDIFSFPPNCDRFGCSKWCSRVPNLQAPFCSDFKDKATCQDHKINGVSCTWLSSNRCDYPYDYKNPTDFGQSCQAGTGCYYGCGSGSNGFQYRSTKNSIMNNQYAKDKEAQEFNAVSKKQIQSKIDAYTK